MRACCSFRGPQAVVAPLLFDRAPGVHENRWHGWVSEERSPLDKVMWKICGRLEALRLSLQMDALFSARRLGCWDTEILECRVRGIKCFSGTLALCLVYGVETHILDCESLSVRLPSELTVFACV